MKVFEWLLMQYTLVKFVLGNGMDLDGQLVGCQKNVLFARIDDSFYVMFIFVYLILMHVITHYVHAFSLTLTRYLVLLSLKLSDMSPLVLLL